MTPELPNVSETLMRVAADLAKSWDHKCPTYLWSLLEGQNRLLGDANGWLGHTMCMRQRCVAPSFHRPRPPTDTSACELSASQPVLMCWDTCMRQLPSPLRTVCLPSPPSLLYLNRYEEAEGFFNLAIKACAELDAVEYGEKLMLAARMHRTHTRDVKKVCCVLPPSELGVRHGQHAGCVRERGSVHDRTLTAPSLRAPVRAAQGAGGAVGAHVGRAAPPGVRCHIGGVAVLHAAGAAGAVLAAQQAHQSVRSLSRPACSTHPPDSVHAATQGSRCTRVSRE